MKELLEKFENKRPELVFEWKDSETEAEGWIVINSLRGGAAGGGTRMRKGLDKREVESLAKTMEIKFSVSGPAIGGAKSGINFDPLDPRKTDVLKRWYKAVYPILKNYYGTGGDMNVDEIHEVIPITEGYGLWHPQEGIVNGHFNPNPSEKIRKLGQLRMGVSKIIENSKYTPSLYEKLMIADMVTGYGVTEAVKHYYNLYNGSLQGKRAIIQGWGNVAAASAFYLALYGVKIVGIIDRTGGVINSEGYDLEQVTALFLNKSGNTLQSPEIISFEETNNQIWDLKADIFIPGAGSRLITKEQIDRMINSGVEVISCGANVPFADSEIFMGPIAEYADSRLSVIPDFIANCGMARVFAFLMTTKEDITDEAIFNDVSDTIKTAMEKARNENSSKLNISATALKIALNQLL
ncbi:MAG: amino acid dehydrogenase [Bacteroidetes bacterium]|nr:amino acid dehydrogenase [Bacteroidota bacterium]HET6245987.1 Glu/Leu/Phe/Val dehydrogenase dimerization domain-containing protein [Bacteroidia bacterium]